MSGRYLTRIYMIIPRLLTKYRKEVVPAMRAEFGHKNVMAVPKIIKVALNVGLSRAAKEPKFIERVENDLAKITGQKPTVRKARKSIAGFKTRQGMPVGMMVTLRGRRMYDFIDRLISIALPRSRDFQGINAKSFDQKGSLSIGIREHNIFPEVTYESLKDIFGLEVTVTTNAQAAKEGIELLRLMGFPIKA